MQGMRKRKFSGISMALVLAGVLMSGPAGAASVVGVLVGGGGIDDMRVEVRDAKGRIVTAYCLDRCGDIFGEPDANEVVNVKKRYRNRKVKLDYESEMNKDRIAGAGEERLEFVKKLELLP